MYIVGMDGGLVWSVCTLGVLGLPHVLMRSRIAIAIIIPLCVVRIVVTVVAVVVAVVVVMTSY